MKKHLLFFLCLGFSFAGSAQSVSNEVDLQLVLPKNGNLENGTVYNDINGNPYKGIKVGEYYWMNNNVNYPMGELPNTKQDIDYIHKCYVMFENWRPPQEPSRRDSTYWQFLNARGRNESQALADFNQYYGQYYKVRPAVTDGLFWGSMKENGVLNTNWGLPSNDAVLQLLAMCGNAESTAEVKKYISANRYDNSTPAFVRVNLLANDRQMPYYWWFANNNNTYGLNFVPAGTKYEQNGNTLNTENYGTIVSYPAYRGTHNGLNQVMNIVTKSCDNFFLHDYPEMAFFTNFSSVPVRYCRPLTDEELGYKLYISIAGNKGELSYPGYLKQHNDGGATRYRTSEEQLLEYIRRDLLKPSDIKIIKLGLTDAVPNGYHELQRGYIRGFYVQYILDNPTPKLVEEIINIALQDQRLWMIRQNGELTIRAIDYKSGKGLTGGVYKIKADRGNKIYGDSIFTTIEGLAVASKLPAPESYTVTEITPPDGYEKTNQSFTVSNSLWFATGEVNPTSVTFEYSKKEELETTNLHFSTYGNPANINTQYTGIRIGEFYWMSENFYTDDSATGVPSTASLNRALDEAKIPREDFAFANMNDFAKYFGRYYSIYEGMNPLITSGKMFEGEQKKETGWHLPKVIEFEQLFGMCGTGSLYDVRTYLGCKVGDNPAAKRLPNVGWYDNNRNTYGYDMMPSGRRFHADEYGYQKGDLNELFVIVKYLTSDWKIIVLRENHSRTYDMLYHWMNMRWCRKLTADELGYKLYINMEYDDSNSGLRKMEETIDSKQVLVRGKIRIIKEDLTSTRQAPAGYTELTDGYLRGFYVQYFMEKPYLDKSLEEIINYTREMRGLAALPIVNDATTSIENEVPESTVRIYPNPVANVLTVESDNIQHLSIYNTIGRMMYITNGSIENKTSIDVSTYPAGIYILQMKDEKGQITRKFVKR